MKNYSFYFHYNKPASRAAGKPVLSVHYRGKCYMVDFVRCEVPIESKNNKRQPFCVMTGKSQNLTIEYIDGKSVAIIWGHLRPLK